MPGIPTPVECEKLLREVGCAPAILAHTGAVAGLARRIAVACAGRGHACDLDLVEAGARLHDIGRARTQGLDHASAGATMLRERHYPEPLVLIVERHTGGGIDPDEARQLGLPVKDYTPRTLEEKIVCQADNLVDGARRQKLQDEVGYLRSRGLPQVARKVEALQRELSALAGRDLDAIA